jgi:putative hydrolase of the HAD superfamily
MATIDWVLFDLGGVLLEVVQPRIFNQLQHLTDIPAVTIEQKLKSAPFFREHFMVKEFTPSEIAQHVNEALGQRLAEADVVAALNAELGAEISSTANLLPTLQRKTKVGCLSNTNSIHWDKLLSSYQFMQTFDRRFASQILGHAKPGKEIYEKVAMNLGAHPRQLLFFDDKPENVETAQRLGWHARVYTSHEQLVADLAEMNLIAS